MLALVAALKASVVWLVVGLEPGCYVLRFNEAPLTYPNCGWALRCTRGPVLELNAQPDWTGTIEIIPADTTGMGGGS